MEKTETVEIDDSKKVMTDGNYISNGKFQEGTEAGKKYLQYWGITGAGTSETFSSIKINVNNLVVVRHHRLS